MKYRFDIVSLGNILTEYNTDNKEEVFKAFHENDWVNLKGSSDCEDGAKSDMEISLRSQNIIKIRCISKEDEVKEIADQSEENAKPESEA